MRPPCIRSVSGRVPTSTRKPLVRFSQLAIVSAKTQGNMKGVVAVPRGWKKAGRHFGTAIARHAVQSVDLPCVGGCPRRSAIVRTVPHLQFTMSDITADP